MPIDASIPLQVQQPKITDPRELYSAAAQIQGANLQNQLGQLQIEGAQRATDRRNSIASVLSQQYEKPEEREEALLRVGAIDEATKLGKDRRDNLKTDADTEKTKLANTRDKMAMVGQLLGGVRDQSSYDQARAVAQMNGLDISNMPQAYDPNLVSMKRQQALSMTEQLDQVWKQKKYDLDVDQFGESRRHNRASEGLTARGQNMSDSRARDLNQITKDNKPLTDAQSKAALFGSRMQSSDEVINSLASSGKMFSTPGSRAGYGVGAAVNVLNSSEGQQLDQAKRDFINATLRRESGAVISDPEFDNAEKQYFPQIGDSPEVMKQKAQNRGVAIRGVQAEVPEGKRGVIDEIRGTAASKTPKAGTVQDGYRFKGGNPADPKSWEKM